MKDFVTKLLIFVAIVFLYSRLGPAIPISVTTQDRGLPLVVEGVGSAVSLPDTAIVNAGIDITGSTLEGVEETASQNSKKLVDSLKALGIEEKDIKTTSYNVYPEYSYEATKQQVIGYRVSINYEIKVKDIALINEVLGTVTENGANTVGGVTFDVSDEAKEKLMDEARREATQKARAKAESLARATGVKLGKVLSISEYETGTPSPIPYLERAADVTSPDTLPNVTPGEGKVEVTVSISYEIR